MVFKYTYRSNGHLLCRDLPASATEALLVAGFHLGSAPRYFLITIIKVFLHPLRRVDDNGRLEKIHLNNATRDSVMDIPLEQVQPFYRALRAITDIGNRPENMVTYKMEPGE